MEDFFEFLNREERLMRRLEELKPVTKVSHIPMLEGTLRILPDYYSAIEVPLKWEDIPEDERDNNSWWYLHGKLEDIVGYDKGTMVNCKTLGLSKPTVDWTSIYGGIVQEVRSENPRWCAYINGVIDVECIGIDKPCVGIFWTSYREQVTYKDTKYDLWEQCGLVCLKDDIEGVLYASSKYEEDFI